LDSRTALSTFSRLNHTCYEIAAPLFYHHLSVIFWDPPTLRKSVSELTEDGQGRRFVKYAKKLSIICLNPDSGNEAQDRPWQLEGCKLGNSRFAEDEPATRNTFLESHLTDPSLSHDGGFALLKGSSGYREQERDWSPLAALIARLCHLGQIEFLADNDFPIALQEAISQHHPKCQLNLWSRQSLKEQESPPGKDLMSLSDGWGIDVNLLRLQGLHTLSVHIPRISEGKSDWIGQTQILPFLFLPPNLKHLILQKSFTRHRLPITKLNQEWLNCATTTHPMPISSLKSLTISQMGPREYILLKLADIVDISQIRSLQLDELFNPPMLAQTAALFPNLERLFISANGRGWRFPNDDKDGIAAILAFNPLKYLHIRGLSSASSLNQIAQHHGPSLKGLIIEPTTGFMGKTGSEYYGYQYPELDAFTISQLAKSCPQLEELRLPIKRYMGNQEECEIYKSLGNFSNLYSLVLDLLFDPTPRLANPRPELEASALKTIFVNATMDEKLALQVWHLISLNQASRRLQNLRVMPLGLRCLPNDEHRLVDWFSRSFLITRYNFQNMGLPTVKEIGKREREIRHQSLFQDSDICIPKRLRRVLSDVWPSDPAENSWESVRSSFPLQSNYV
jgi:hypothetical protein